MGDGSVGEGEAWSGGALPEGTGAVELFDQIACRGTRHQERVDAQIARSGRTRALSRQQDRKPLHRRLDLVLLHREPRGHAVTAAFQKQALSRQPLDRGAKVDAFHRPPGALAEIAIKADDDSGAVRRLLQPRCDDADDAGVPTLAGRPDEWRVKPARFCLRHRGVAHPVLDVPPLGVEHVQPLGQCGGLMRIGGGKEPRAEIGRADPPACVDTGSEEVTEMIGRRRAVHARDIRQRGKPDALAPRHHLQPLPYQRPVDADQRRYVGDSGQSHEIEQRHEVGAGYAIASHLPVRLDQHQENHGGGAEMAKFVRSRPAGSDSPRPGRGAGSRPRDGGRGR